MAGRTWSEIVSTAAAVARFAPVPGRGGSSERRPRCLIASVRFTNPAKPPVHASESRAPFGGEILYVVGTPPTSEGEPLAFIAARVTREEMSKK